MARLDFLACVLLCAACASEPAPRAGRLRGRSLPAPSSSAGAVPKAVDQPPPVAWPTAPESAPPKGFTWQTVHHEEIHARVLVPAAAKVERTHDAYGYPRVDIDVDSNIVFLQFDSGVGALGNTLAKTPPTVYGLPVEKVHVGAENLAARYRTKPGDLRIMGFARGVKCTFEPFRDLDEATLDRIFTLCASLRTPPLGPWRRATAEERAHGGMTDVPEGAWIEGALPSTPGSMLRPGKFIARMHLGGLVVRGAVCPPSVDVLRERDVGEIEVSVDERATARGAVWIRQATELQLGDRLPGATTIFSPRGGGCCRADFVPWTSPPSADEVTYAIALCDTFRAE